MGTANDAKEGHPGGCPSAQSVKEPLFSLGGSGGFGVYWGKNEPYCGEKGVVPTPIC